MTVRESAPATRAAPARKRTGTQSRARLSVVTRSVLRREGANDPPRARYAS